MEKKKSSLYKKGKSGNLRGRPKGVKNKSTLLQEVLRTKSVDFMMEHLQSILEAVVVEAKKGNMQAAKMILDRAIPVKKAVELTTSDKGFGGVNIIIGSLEQTQLEVIAESDIVDVEFEEESE